MAVGRTVSWTKLIPHGLEVQLRQRKLTPRDNCCGHNGELTQWSNKKQSQEASPFVNLSIATALGTLTDRYNG